MDNRRAWVELAAKKGFKACTNGIGWMRTQVMRFVPWQITILLAPNQCNLPCNECDGENLTPNQIAALLGRRKNAPLSTWLYCSDVIAHARKLVPDSSSAPVPD
jgi:hypothetical protein